MSENSKIEWTDHTFNPFIGCTKVSPGCDNCYAEAMMDKRMHKVVWGPQQPRVRTSATNWREPLKWNARHDAFFAEHGRRQRVFCASLADVFDNAIDTAWREDVFDLIRATLNLDWLLLTKRIGNVRKMLEDAADHAFNHRRDDLHQWLVAWLNGDAPLNVWLGATIVNQEEASRDVPKLLSMPARVRFLSMEPLLGPVDLSSIPANLVTAAGVDAGYDWFDPLTGVGITPNGRQEDDEEPAYPRLDWIIVGGESGHGARPMDTAWAQSLRQQCVDAGARFFMKQMGGVRDKRGALGDLPKDLQVREHPHA